MPTNTASTFSSVKLSRELVNHAREEAAVFSRSIAGQLEHWAKIGRAVEQAPGFTIDRARAALDGRLDPAELSPQERVYYYDLLDNDLASPSPAESAAMAAIGSGTGAVGYDDDGRLVRRNADGSTTVLEA